MTTNRTATIHNWIQTGILVLAAGTALVVMTNYISGGITRVEMKVDTIRTNDLPHIDQRLTRLERHFGIKEGD